MKVIKEIKLKNQVGELEHVLQFVVDSISYQRHDGKNLLTMKKNIRNYDTNI